MTDHAAPLRTSPARPFTTAFRVWVQECLAILGTSALAIGRDLNLGKNTLQEFLRDPSRNIHLENAHDISCRLRALAADQGKVLPRLTVRFNG